MTTNTGPDREGQTMSAEPRPKNSGRFQPGQSGNPRGKPKGAIHTATLAARALLSGELDEICRQIVAKAKGGDMTAAKIIVDKILPNAREVPLSISLPPLNQVRDMAGVARAILDAASNGRILPGEAASLADLLATLARAVGTVELEERLAVLETRLAAGSS
jgi:hypothetical protein